MHTAAAVGAGLPLVDLKGRAISAPVAPLDWCRGALQGTIRIHAADGSARVFGLAGTAADLLVDCSPLQGRYGAWVAGLGRNRFQASRGPFGVGESGLFLVPYRTIAVDKRAIPYQSVLFIPAARGVAFSDPGGRTLRHDGFFFAADTGPSLQPAQIDVFLGVATANPFSFIGSTATRTFVAYIIPDAQIASRLRALHAPF